jgi:hypothetical protein
MSHMPINRKLQPLVKPQRRHVETAVKLWPRVVAAITNSDMLAVITFSLIGLLLTINFMLRFTDLGAVIEQYNQF